jgi:hypothetical protein
MIKLKEEEPLENQLEKLIEESPNALAETVAENLQENVKKKKFYDDQKGWGWKYKKWRKYWNKPHYSKKQLREIIQKDFNEFRKYCEVPCENGSHMVTKIEFEMLLRPFHRFSRKNKIRFTRKEKQYNKFLSDAHGLHFKGQRSIDYCKLCNKIVGYWDQPNVNADEHFKKEHTPDNFYKNKKIYRKKIKEWNKKYYEKNSLKKE